MRQVAQIVEGGPGCVDGGAEQRRQLRIRRRLRTGEPQLVGQREQTLLGAVVEVALEQAPCGVAARDDPSARAAEVLELCRTAACSRSLSTARRAAAPISRSSAGASSRAASWSTTATCSPARAMRVVARDPPGGGSGSVRPSVPT